MELFDVFRGKNVPEGQEHGLRLHLSNPEKTLKDEEVMRPMKSWSEQLKLKLQATIR